jgi:hypothetical protein
MQHHPICQPRLTKRGVAFAVSNGVKERECLISTAALERVAALKNVDASDADPMDVFRAFEETINGVARRLVAADGASRLICLQPESFENMPATKPASSLFGVHAGSGKRPRSNDPG